jgi:hypothetical protein
MRIREHDLVRPPGSNHVLHARDRFLERHGRERDAENDAHGTAGRRRDQREMASPVDPGRTTRTV